MKRIVLAAALLAASMPIAASACPTGEFPRYDLYLVTNQLGMRMPGFDPREIRSPTAPCFPGEGVTYHFPQIPALVFKSPAEGGRAYANFREVKAFWMSYDLTPETFGQGIALVGEDYERWLEKTYQITKR